MDQLNFFVGRKNSKTFGCAIDFLKMLLKFKMAARSQLQNFCGCKNLMSEIMQILLSHPPPYGDVQVTFSRFYRNSKWPPGTNLNFLGAGKLKKLVWSIF